MVFAEPGESCLSGETCISNYVCINGSCLCPDGEVSRDGNCVKEDIEIKKHISYQGNSDNFLSLSILLSLFLHGPSTTDPNVLFLN